MAPAPGCVEDVRTTEDLDEEFEEIFSSIASTAQNSIRAGSPVEEAWRSLVKEAPPTWAPKPLQQTEEADHRRDSRLPSDLQPEGAGAAGAGSAEDDCRALARETWRRKGSNSGTRSFGRQSSSDPEGAAVKEVCFDDYEKEATAQEKWHCQEDKTLNTVMKRVWNKVRAARRLSNVVNNDKERSGEEGEGAQVKLPRIPAAAGTQAE